MDPPPGLIPVPLKGAVLLLTEAEYRAGIRRGKWWRRRKAMQPRKQEDSVAIRAALRPSS